MRNFFSMKPEFIGQIMISDIYIRKFNPWIAADRKRFHLHTVLSLPADVRRRILNAPFDKSAYRLPCLIGHTESGRFSDAAVLLIYIHGGTQSAFFLTGKQDRSKKTPGEILKRLPSAVVINGGPGGHRPAVI